MEVGIFNGIKKDSRTLLTEERTTKDRYVQHDSEKAQEGRGSHDESAGCDLEETTMLTVNEPALGALVDVVARLKGGIRIAVEHSPADQGVARTLKSAPETAMVDTTCWMS